MMTPRFNRFIAPARAKPQIWRIVAGLIVIVATYVALLFAVFAATGLLLTPEDARRLSAALDTPDTPATVFLLLATFPGAAVGAFLAVRVLHKRSPATLFGPRVALVRDFSRASMTMIGLSAIYLLFWSLFFDPVPNLPFVEWLGYLPLLLIGLLVQTGTEELIFRGYLQQQLAARFRSPLVWMLLPSLAFAALHYDPAQPDLANAFVIAATALFGILAADLTRITGNLGAAWGFHFANNLLAIGLLALDGSITGLALYLTPYDTAEIVRRPLLLASDMAATLIAWAVLRSLLRR